MFLHPRKQPPYVVWTALLTVLTLIATLFPALPALEVYAASDKFTLNKSVLSVGYATAQIQATGSDSFPFKSDTKVSLFDQYGTLMRVIDDVRLQDSKHMVFTINPGLHEGRYSLMITSYDSATVDLNVMTTYDPTGVVITPGVDREFRIDWTDPTDLLGSNIVIQYGPINQQYFTSQPVSVPRGVQTATIKLPKAEYEANKAYKFQIYSDNLQAKKLEFNNGGRGYAAVDTTPPGDIKDIRVTTVSNGFRVDWTNPDNDDLDLVTVQYAEHGTTNWSDGFVVKAPTSSTVLQPLNLAKRYDLRFIKTDKYANWAYQIDNHNGYGYTYDTKPPMDVASITINPQSETSAYITWYDPQANNTSTTDDDFHHVNIYLKSPLTDWKQVGRVNKGVQAYTLTGLAPFIDYTLRMTAVDNRGNETVPGVMSNTFHVGSKTSTDRTNLTTVDIQQEVGGGLSLKWTSDNLASVDYSQFKMYYAPANKQNLLPEDWKETVVSNRSLKTASLRDMPRGLYFLQMRAYDSHGVEQELQTYRGSDGRSDGYYVSGTNNGLPTEVSSVRIQPNNGREMVLTWNAASSTGTHVALYHAERSTFPNWKFVAKIDKRDQRYSVTGLNPNTNYFFKLVAVDSATNLESPGVTYDNSGYGYNLLNGDTYPPAEVTNATASLSLNTLTVTYDEPNDPDFDMVKIYAQKVGSSEQASVITAPRGSNGATLRELMPGAAYTLRLTTVDIYGNESQGVTLTNNSQGYAIAGGGQAIDEVRNALLIPDGNKLTVRFLDPLAADYKSTTIALKKRTESGYGSARTVSKGSLSEITFSNLESNQQYQVFLYTESTSGKKSNGIVLGGDTGISLLPISSVTDAFVTPGQNRLKVSWLDPANSVPTSLQVEVQKSGSNKWSEPLIVQPKTQQAVFHGLDNNATYKVRITAVMNNIGSAGIVLDNSYTPRAMSLVPSLPKIAQHPT
ncbi:MAG: fibronectin type III domain-containing protein, partial [Tumebacillaceae bacterium]